MSEQKCEYLYHDTDTAALGYCASCVQKEMNKMREQGTQYDFWGYPIIENKTTVCECGAEKTSNPNMHAFYCPKWRKT